MTDKLVEVKEKKLINIDKFKKLAEKVVKDIQQQRDYVKERNESNGHTISTGTYSIS